MFEDKMKKERYPWLKRSKSSKVNILLFLSQKGDILFNPNYSDNTHFTIDSLVVDENEENVSSMSFNY